MMDLPPTMRVNGELFFLVMARTGTAALHASLLLFYMTAARLDRIVLDHSSAGFETEDVLDAVKALALPHELRLIVMGPNEGFADVTLLPPDRE